MGPNKEKSNTCYGVGEVGAGLWWALRFLKFIIFEINSRLSLVFRTNWFLAKVYYSDTYFWDDGKVAVCTIFPGRCYADIFNKGLIFFYQRKSSACTIFLRRVFRAVLHC